MKFKRNPASRANRKVAALNHAEKMRRLAERDPWWATRLRVK